MALPKRKSTAFRVPKGIGATLDEAARHYAATTDGRVQRPRTELLHQFVSEYIRENWEDFEKKVPVDEEGFPHYVYEGENAPLDIEDDSQEEDQEDNEEKLTFSMSDGPPDIGVGDRDDDADE